MKPIVALDVDGVLIDHTRYHLCRVNTKYGTRYKYSDVTAFDYRNFPREIRNEFYRMWSDEEGMYRTHLLDTDDLTALNSLNISSRPIVVSTILPGHIQAKYSFLARYFNPADIFFTASKDLIIADLLVDDAPHNIDGWTHAHPHKRAYIYDRPWNHEYQKTAQLNPNVRVVRSLQEVASYVKEDFPCVA